MIRFWVYNAVWKFLGTVEATGYHAAVDLADCVFNVENAMVSERPLHMLKIAA